MSSINFTCDSCGREVMGCTFVNGMKFCAKCYQETFGNNDKDKRIADLEAKLAEKEHSIEMLNQHLTDKALEVEKADRMFRDCEADRKFEQEKKNIALKRVSELTEQLAEKEKEIERIKNNYLGGMQNANEATRIFKEKYYKSNQDKIELLETLKHDIWTNQQDNGWLDEQVDIYELTEMIEALIKEIKGE